MEKGGLIKPVFILVIFIFTAFILSSGIYAAPPTNGTCSIVPLADCEESKGEGYMLAYLSDPTSAHAAVLQDNSGGYQYVLCCNLGDGNKNCTGVNTLFKLSSSTNAHAEIPTQINYPTLKICYEDFICRKATNCTSQEGGILSLTADTNAHIGKFEDYPTKICCIGTAITNSRCRLTSAAWNREEVSTGSSAYLNVIGDSACNGVQVSFQVWRKGGLFEADTPANILPMNATLRNVNGVVSAISEWAAEWQEGGLFSGNPNYYFKTWVTKNPAIALTSSSDALLTVTEYNMCTGFEPQICGTYTDENDCMADSCNVAAKSSTDEEINCSDSSIICACTWDTETLACGFNYAEIVDCGNPTAGCNYGCTLCVNSTTQEKYCNLDTCPTGEIPADNNDSICDEGEGCLSSDCNNGDVDTCAEPYYCSEGKCSTLMPLGLNTTLGLGNCKISQTIEKNCDDEPVGYRIISWTGVWTEGEAEINDAANCLGKASCLKCVAGGKSTVQCPAQVQLPFTNVLGLIITILAIALVYFFLMRRKKHAHKMNAKPKKSGKTKRK